MGNTEWTDEQRAWIKTRRKRHLRILAAVLSLCVLFATYPNILETFFVFAAEREKEEKDLYISGFSDLPEEIKEQTVPLGTGLEELTLPDTLEAVVVQDGQGSAENSDEDADDREIGDADEETDAKTPSDKDEIGEDTGEPSDGEETGEETTEPSDGEETGGETAEPSDGEETGGETAELSDGKESEADNSGSTEENENVDQVEQDTQPEEAAAEETIIIESGDETGGEGDSALSGESEDTELKQETHTVTLPEYQAERVITVERLENPSEKENKEDADDIEKSQAYDTDTVIITGVTWQPHPAYDKDTEGVYLFTAVLPEGYARMEGIGLPRITVTVEESENVRLFLERAKILPYLESLLEDAPGEEEEGYEAWEALFLESLAEAEELKELYDAFTETERAQISADIYEKLAAWWEYADFMEEAVVYAASGTDWTLDDAGLLTIKSDAGMTDWYTNGKPYHGGEVEEAVIEGGVTSVREQAFGTSCKRLARVKILSGVKNIGEGAFMNCEGLERVEIPSSVENIEKNAFYRCEKLTDVVLPSGITGIGEGAFVACKSLTNMEIPSSVTSLGDRVFANCWELTSVKIPENVTGIGVNMFLSCKKLTSIEIPAAVTSIGNTAFSGCTELTKVKMFGETPPTLGTDVFEGCGFVTAGTEGIRVPKGKASAYKITWTDWAAYITADAGWTLDNGVLTIESNDGMTDWAANGRVDENDNVKSVIIKSGVTSIIANAFSQCGNLARIEIPNTVTIIDEAALFGCINLESVEMPDGVKSIAAQAFKSSGLTSIEIPRSVTGIGDGTFQNCSKLTKVEMFSAIPPTLGVSAFEGSGFVKTNVKGKGILVPKGKAEDYKNAAGWSSYADYITDGSPFITAQPTDQMVQNGKSVTFSVTADAMDGTGTMSYQWQVDKKTGTFADVSGATSAAYTISTADKANDGYIYRCVVTNDRGTATSEAVTLTVTPSEAEKVAAAKKVVQDTLADITATNGTTKTDIQNAIDTALSNANMTDVTVTVGDLSKTEATSSAPGSVSGSVSIVSKNDSDVSDSVTISKTIEKLPLSEAEKVAAAKKIVQDVLAGITATNETTKEDIQNAIDTALSNAGITDVTVTVGDLSKTEATTGATGSLSGTVSVTSQNDSSVEDSVTINKTIVKLPATEAEKVAAAKKIVQDVLAGITATNETTKEDIQDAIDTALSDAGIEDVTVKVGDLSKTEATSDAPGNISGDVSVVSKRDSTVRDDVTINKTIPATGESHTHNYEEWRHDAKEHWKVCSCGAAGAKSKHRYDNDRDTTCNDCGYKRKVKNPDKGESDKDKPDHAGSETQNPTGNQQPTDTQPPVNPPTVAPVKTPQPVPGTADDPAKQHGAQTPKQPERKPGQDTGQEGKATVQQGGMDSAKITAEQRSEGGTAQTDSGQQSEGSAVQTDNAQQAEGGTARTVQAAADGGRIAIPGEAVETGNLTENQKTATKFELEKGAVTVSVVCDDGKCTAGVNDTAAVANTVLTPEQIQLANDGENIEVRIDVKDISQTVAEQDKEVIESGLVRYREEMPELTLGRYVDISVFVKIGEGDWDAVTSTGEPIEVVMGIPRELVENGRTFYVIRAHGGEYTLLTDMDDDPETVTIRTDLFSAYALAYRQADGTGESGRCGLCHICPTFLGICYFIWLIMIVAVVATGIILLRKKKN